MNEGFPEKSACNRLNSCLTGPSTDLTGLAGTRQNRYIGRNLHVSYDRVLRVGPPGPALFYYLNQASRPIGRRLMFGEPAGPRLKALSNL
jgi:hypothetical protein